MTNRRVAVVDIGTNTLKFSVTAVDASGNQTVVDSSAETVRLGYRLADTGQIEDVRADRALAALIDYEQRARMFGVEACIGVATAAVRSAANGAAVLQQWESQTSWNISVISGEEEAQLAFEGLSSILPEVGHATIVDIGGGSTEIITTVNQARVASTSVALGSGLLADRVFRQDPPGLDAVVLAKDYARSVLSGWDLPTLVPGGLMVLSGGNGQFLRAMAAWPGIGEPFAPEHFEGIVSGLATTDAETVAEVLAIVEERARMLPAGAAIASVLMEFLSPSGLFATPSGLRGAIVDRWFRSLGGPAAQA